MALKVKKFSLPVAGIDHVDITINETYDVQGVGKDTVTLKGRLVANRATPLLGHGQKTTDWKTSTVVAQFTELSLVGESRVFGAVHVTLDHSQPSFGVVQAGKCAAAIGINVSMPQHNLMLKSASPIQLQSTVQTVPPIGDEKTESIGPVDLVELETGRKRGAIEHVQVAWRDLVQQIKH